MTIRITRRAFGAGASASVALLILLLGAAAPASADEPEDQDPQSCAVGEDDAWVVCVPVGDDLAGAVLEQVGYTLVDSAEEVQGRGILTIYTMTTLFENASYGGASVTLTSTTPCNGSTLHNYPNLGSYGFNDRASSLISGSGCGTKLYANTNLMGSATGYIGSSSNLGTYGFNDIASSATVA